MLESTNIITTLSGETSRVSAARGACREVRSLVVDELLWELNDNGYYTARYEDDITILVNGKFP
jgi:hypothetical protein